MHSLRKISKYGNLATLRVLQGSWDVARLVLNSLVRQCSSRHTSLLWVLRLSKADGLNIKHPQVSCAASTSTLVLCTKVALGRALILLQCRDKRIYILSAHCCTAVPDAALSWNRRSRQPRWSIQRLFQSSPWSWHNAHLSDWLSQLAFLW